MEGGFESTTVDTAGSGSVDPGSYTGSSTPDSFSGGSETQQAEQSTEKNIGEGLKSQLSGPEEGKQHRQPKRPDNLTKVEEEIQRRKFRLKIDGEEIEEELDDHEITVRLQKERAAAKRFEEAARRTKEINAILAKAKEDPAGFLQEFGVDPDEFAKSRLDAEIERLKKTPEQLQMEEYERRISEFEAREMQAREAEERAQREAYQKQVTEQVHAEFLEALDSLGYEDKGFERTVLLPLMAEIALANEQFGVGLSPAQLAREAERRLNTIAQKPLKTLKGEKLLKFVGEDAAKEIMRASLSRRRASANNPLPQPREAAKQKPPAPEQPRKPRPPNAFFLENVLGVEFD